MRRKGLNGHFGTVRSIALSNDGALALTAGNSHPDQTVKLWDLHRAELIHSLPEQAEFGGHTALAIVKDRFLTSFNDEIRLWGLESGKELRRIRQETRSSWFDVRFIDEDALLAASGEQAWVIGIESGDANALATGGSEVLAVAASDSGEVLAVQYRDSLSLWWHHEGKVERIHTLETPPGDLFFLQRPPLQFTGDDRLLFVSP